MIRNSILTALSDRIPFPAFMLVMVPFWLATVVVVAVTFSLAVRPERTRSASAPSPGPVATARAAPNRPAEVPDAAQSVEHDLTLGDVKDAIQFLFAFGCHDDVITMITSKATVYASSPCERSVSPDTIRRLAGQPVRTRIAGNTMILEAFLVASFSIPVEHVWIVTR